MSKASSRRDFLKKGVAAGLVGIGAPTIIPSRVLGQPGRRVGASDQVIMAGIGVGSRGRAVIRDFNGIEEVQVAAVADVDLNRARLSGADVEAEVYQDYRRVLDRPDIDAVYIAVPDHWHALITMHAVQAGRMSTARSRCRIRSVKAGSWSMQPSTMIGS